MYQKGNIYLADWRDRSGARKRKAFGTAAVAEQYEASQKQVARPKKKGAGLQSQAFSRRISKARTVGGGPSGSLSNSTAHSGRATSHPQASSKSTVESGKPKTASRGGTGRKTQSASSSRSTKITAGRSWPIVSLGKQAHVRAISQRRQKSGSKSLKHPHQI